MTRYHCIHMLVSSIHYTVIKLQHPATRKADNQSLILDDFPGNFALDKKGSLALE